MGRKPADGRTVKRATIPIRCSPGYKARVERRAKELEITITEYIRRLIDKDLKGE